MTIRTRGAVSRRRFVGCVAPEITKLSSERGKAPRRTWRRPAGVTSIRFFQLSGSCRLRLINRLITENVFTNHADRGTILSAVRQFWGRAAFRALCGSFRRALSIFGRNFTCGMAAGHRILLRAIERPWQRLPTAAHGAPLASCSISLHLICYRDVTMKKWARRSLWRGSMSSRRRMNGK